MQDNKKLPELSKSYPSTGSGRTDFIISLRDLIKDDALIIAEYAGDYDIAKMVATMPHPYSLEDAYAFLDKIKGQIKAGEGHSLAITFDGDFAGSIGWFYNEEHVLEIGYWVAKPYWGKGVACKALALILELVKVECADETEVLGNYMEENPASGRVLEKNGFVRDGRGEDCFSLARGEARPAIRMLKKL